MNKLSYLIATTAIGFGIATGVLGAQNIAQRERIQGLKLYTLYLEETQGQELPAAFHRGEVNSLRGLAEAFRPESPICARVAEDAADWEQGRKIK